MSDAAAQKPIRVLLADDHALVREGIRHVLSDAPGFEVVGEASRGAEALDLARELVPGTRVLILSIHDHEEYVLQSVRAGAHGYLRKDSSPTELRDAIRAVHQGGTFFSAPVAQQLGAALRGEGAATVMANRLGLLTARERDVLTGIASGATNKDMAAQLGISTRTVESHRESLMRKLDIRTVAGLTRFAVDSGLLPG